ncbi:MAG TPA: hypothetical protein EYP29_04555, partial [Thermoplasmata archaeon]|nr:hypothetical protein [Thermoplasmata archaeon]
MQVKRRQILHIVFPIVFGLFLLLLLKGQLSEGKTIVVDESGNGDYTTIQEAIDNASVGDTIRVWEGTYKGPIEINKTLTILGNGTTNTTIDGDEKGNVVNVSSPYVNLSGFTIKNSGEFFSGIYSEGDMGLFKDLILTKNYFGIYFKNTEKSSMEGCELYLNTKVGIYLVNSNHSIIKNNTIYKNEDGIALLASSYNHVINNTIYNNSDDGIDVDADCTKNKILNNYVATNDFGIILTSSRHNLIENNTVKANKYYGISLYMKSNNNKLSRNNVTHNLGFGIAVYASNNTTIISNHIYKNGMVGITPVVGGVYSNLSHNNSLLENLIANNTGVGIYLEN